ncbi:hypothetical protein [Vibrio parahaemolyticus]|uniref:hypothetical protein n=1 Tax=Vibrio parahaemolyticus TaxID=670 RepID=UPI0023629956|nr:hypothetical protein [Vibrio parahaemolyticus]
MSTHPKMHQLLQLMNKSASFEKGCEPDFAIIPDKDGMDTENHYGQQEDLFIDLLLGSGAKVFKVRPNESVIVCDLPLGNCHSNVLQEAGEGDTIFTGFAQVAYPDGSGGDWFPHSWLTDSEGKLVETFSNAFPTYFGVALIGDNLDLFKDYTKNLQY